MARRKTADSQTAAGEDAGQAIRAGLAEAARLGVPAVLETATPANVGLYQRLGFATRSEWDVAGGGPHFWTMTRPAEPDPTTP